MHYRHVYHAGNFADVFKHVLLCGLVQAFTRKDKPWAYLETHAGAGLYDLSGVAAAKTAEWQDGIGRLKEVREAPEPLMAFLKCVRAQKQQRYPGSPLFAQAVGNGRLVLCEKVEEVWLDLKSRIEGAEIHQRDGYESHGLLPPKEKRGLILIDPPFEARDEFERISDYLEKAVTRFRGGVYAIWYPLKNRHEAQRFLRRCTRLKVEGINFEFDNGAHAEGQMRACGLLVLNPPFKLVEEMEPALKILAKRLAQGPRAGYEIKTLEQLEK